MRAAGLSDMSRWRFGMNPSCLPTASRMGCDSAATRRGSDGDSGHNGVLCFVERMSVVFTAAIQSISMSKGPGHLGDLLHQRCAVGTVLLRR